jgi:precorrin-6B methylase 2
VALYNELEVIRMTITDGLDVLQRLLAEKPSFHMSGEAHWDALPGALDYLRRSVRPGDVTLEVGAGVSTVVFAAAGARHTVISPDPDEHRLIRDYCERTGIDHTNVRFFVGRSEDVLPTILSHDRVLDLAFIDGSHSYPVPVTDWFYVTRSLKPGGKLLMDDIAIPAAGQVFRHMRLEPGWRVDEILDNRAAALTMLTAPSDEDEWTQQPFNRKYPDFSFASMPRRLRLRAEWQRREFRRAVGRRFPALRRIYRHRS